jgi:hypothetical protein
MEEESLSNGCVDPFDSVTEKKGLKPRPYRTAF